MVKIRLTRTGRKNQPSYRVVATNSRSKRDGSVLEYLGHYSPISKDFVCEKERVEYWISTGAQMSDTVARLMVKNNLLDKKYLPAKQKFAKKAGQKATERVEKKAAAAEATKAEVEKPAAESAATASTEEVVAEVETKESEAAEESKTEK